MKNILSILSIVLSLIFFSNCDKVKNPVITKTVAIGSVFDSVDNAAVANYKKVLLEDYTGHKCGNCPAAARLAHTLSNQYKDTLVVVAIHAGFFAKTNSEFPTSYTTSVGNDWDGAAGFNVSASGNPNGMVNRKIIPGFTLIHKDTWATTVNIAKKDPFLVRIDLTSKYDPTARALNVATKLTFNTAYSNNVKLSLIIMEDGVVGPQLDYSQNPDHIDEYEFEHMLRASINGTWGDLVKAAPISQNSTASIEHNNFAVDTKFNDAKLYLVAFAFDEVTREVLQVEKVKIKK